MNFQNLWGQSCIKYFFINIKAMDYSETGKDETMKFVI